VAAPTVPPAPHRLATTASRSVTPVLPAEQRWQKVESKRSRRQRLKAARPRRPGPVDLAGRCFNCFSPSHRAAQCQQRTRCFKCHVLGHRSFECRELLGGDVGSFKSSKLRNQSTSAGRRPALPVKVWRPKVVAPAAPVFIAGFTSRPRPSSSVEEATTAGDVELGAKAEPSQEGLRSRCRRRPPKKQAPSPALEDPPPDSSSPMPGAAIVHDQSLPRPSNQSSLPCVLDWTNRITLAEED
jgi:hypothetical protein